MSVTFRNKEFIEKAVLFLQGVACGLLMGAPVLLSAFGVIGG
ncbi:hypothetical protein [Lacisediminimonas profundi]|nr:hypothetical protein [Lacisediminimonas profundi]